MSVMESKADDARVLPYAALTNEIVALARAASIEVDVADVPALAASRRFLRPGTRVYVSHLPQRGWEPTVAACVAVRAAGFEPIPHVPVRLLPDRALLERLLAQLAADASVKELLLIAGDRPQPLGPYPQVAEVLRSGLLERYGMQRMSLAGHPEGHPSVPTDTIRAAEREKVSLAREHGLEPTLLTQFFFESAPFLTWSRELRGDGVQARVIAGLAGPASISTLLRFARRCGVGPSIRALSTRGGSLLALLGERGPESVVRELASARLQAPTQFDGIHLFCFGGFLRTCAWLAAVTEGRFELDASGFTVEAEPVG